MLLFLTSGRITINCFILLCLKHLHCLLRSTAQAGYNTAHCALVKLSKAPCSALLQARRCVNQLLGELHDIYRLYKTLKLIIKILVLSPFPRVNRIETKALQCPVCVVTTSYVYMLTRQIFLYS